MTKMNSKIELTQAPIIKHALLDIGNDLTKRLDNLNVENLVATNDTIKTMKSLRADLNKELKEYEDQRKIVKNAVAKPYVDFENVYKTEVSAKYKKAVDILKDKISSFEMKVKANKKENIERYFNELCQVEKIDFLKFDQIGLDINLSTSEKQYKKKCNEFVVKIHDDLKLIESEDFKAEILVEYKSCLNSSKAITSVRERKESERLEKERIKQQETKRRESILRDSGLVYHDMTKSFCFAGDDSIFIKFSDIENLEKNEFEKKFISIESSINEFKRLKHEQEQKYKKKEVKTSVVEKSKCEPKKETVKPLQAPKKLEQPEEKKETFTASFEVTGTMAQLKALGEYMKQNNINYKNI